MQNNGVSLQGALVVQPAASTSSLSRTVFLQQYLLQYARIPTQNALLAYDATQLLFITAMRIGTPFVQFSNASDFTSAIIQAANTVSFTGATGTVRFSTNQMVRSVAPLYCVWNAVSYDFSPSGCSSTKSDFNPLHPISWPGYGTVS